MEDDVCKLSNARAFDLRDPVLIQHHIRWEVRILWTGGRDMHEASACGGDISLGISLEPTRQFPPEAGFWVGYPAVCLYGRIQILA